MFHWMPVAAQALKSVLLVEDSFFNKEMRPFSRIRAHQSTSETFHTSLWRRKTKQASVNYFAIVVLATNKTCGTYFRDKFLSFLCCGTSCFNNDFHHNVKKNLFHVSTNILAFVPVYWLARGPRDRYCCLQWSRFSMLHLDVLLLLHCWLN